MQPVEADLSLCSHEASHSAVTQSIGGSSAISKWTEPALSGVYSSSFGREAPVGGKVKSLTCAGRKARAGLQGESEQVQTMGPPRGRERGWKEGHVAGRRGWTTAAAQASDPGLRRGVRSGGNTDSSTTRTE